MLLCKTAFELFPFKRQRDIVLDGAPIQQPRLLKNKSDPITADRDCSRRMIVEFRDEVEDRRFSATRRPQDRCERTVLRFEVYILQNAQLFATWEDKFFRVVCQRYRAHCSAGTSVRHRVRRCSIGLNSRSSI